MSTSAVIPRNQRLDFGQYDRSPELTDDENRTFETWAARPLFKLEQHRLPRLFRPIADVLSSDDFEPQGRLRTIRFVLEEVGRRRQAYWGWGDEEWLELLHSPAATSNKVTKPYLLAVAYTLSGFRRMYDLRFSFSLPLTARAVFGAALFDHECQRLLEGKRGDEAHLPARPLNVLGRSGARSFRLTLWIALMTTRRASGIAGSRF